MGQFLDSWYSYQFRYCSVNNSGVILLKVNEDDLNTFLVDMDIDDDQWEIVNNTIDSNGFFGYY